MNGRGAKENRLQFRLFILFYLFRQIQAYCSIECALLVKKISIR